MKPSTRYTILLVLLVTTGAGLYVDAAAPTVPMAPETEAVALPPPTSGAQYCPAVADSDESVRLTLLAVDEAARVTVAAGDEVVEERRVSPQDPTLVELGRAAAQRPVTVHWDGGAVLATYETVGEGAQIVQSCVPTTAPRWHVAGFNTTLGNNAILHLFNPFSVDAVARVSYATPEGSVELVTTQDLAVPAGETVHLDLDEVQPEVFDLGVVVDVLTGRLVATGEMRFAPPDADTPGPTGRTALAGVAQASQEHLFAYGAVAEDTADTWVSIMNPDLEREALVLLSVSNPDPEAPVAGEIPVPPGGTVRVETSGTSERRTFATMVDVVNDVPVVATRFALRSVDGQTAIDAATATERRTEWVLVGAGTQDRQGHIDVYNPGAEPARVSLTPVGAEQPQEWTSVEIAPNGQRGFPLADLGVSRPAVPVRLSTDVPVSASVRSSVAEGGAMGFWTLAGFSKAAWSGLATRPSVDFEPTLGRDPLPTVSATETPDP